MHIYPKVHSTFTSYEKQDSLSSMVHIKVKRTNFVSPFPETLLREYDKVLPYVSEMVCIAGQQRKQHHSSLSGFSSLIPTCIHYQIHW